MVLVRDIIYDIETYPNVCTFCFADTVERKMKVFELSSRKDQREEMFVYLRNIYKNKYRLVGFNNVGFDYPVVHKLLTNQHMTVKQVYDYAMTVIKAENKWEHVVRAKDVLIPQVDLYKIHHFDNKARATSLKMIEYNSRAPNIEDLPFPVGTRLNDDEIDVLIKYNMHDVKETFKFYEQSSTQLEFRGVLTKQYGIDMTNFNDTKIGKEYFTMELEKNGVTCYNGGKVRQTKRPYINLADCIFPYIEFERPEFKAVHEWFMKQTITETKGVFSDIMEHELGDVAKYARMTIKRIKLKGEPTEDEIAELKKDKPLCWIEVNELKAKYPKKLGGGFKKAYYVCWNIAEALNVEINGLMYVFGVGGIHASVESQVITADENYSILDWDVASFYPNLAIKNRIYPEHLSEQFCDIYEYMYNLRKEYKKQGKDLEQGMLKLALNGTYGASNDQYSPFYDPKFTMMITINGQLSLCMAVEKMLNYQDVEIIQCNTDGFTLKIRNDDIEDSCQMVKWWEDVTKLELERNDYSKMVIRDVNNYIAVYNNGKLKNKGAYEWEDLPHHKNQSALVVKMAAQAYLINNTDPYEFIRSHKDKFDFMLRTKVPRSSKLVLVDDEGNDNQVQNICRYYMSTNGEEMIKVMPPLEPTKIEQVWENVELMDEVVISSKSDISKYNKKGYTYLRDIVIDCPPRRFNIESGWKVKVTNDINNFEWDINYDYYVQRTWKLIQFAEESDVINNDVDTN
jgi:hypothetical protein